MSRDKPFCGRTSCLCSLLRQTSGDMIHIHLSIGRRPICPFIWDTWALGHSLLLPSQKPWLFFFFSVAWCWTYFTKMWDSYDNQTAGGTRRGVADASDEVLLLGLGDRLPSNKKYTPQSQRDGRGQWQYEGSSVMSKWCSVGYWKARKWAKKISLTALQPEQFIWGRGRLTFSMQIWDAESLCFPVLMPAIRLKTASLLQKNCINVPLNSCAR